MCSCEGAAVCRRCRESDERDWLIQFEPDPRELEETARYEQRQRQLPEDVTP